MELVNINAMQKKYDKLSTGFAVGILLPIAVFAVAMYLRYTNSPQMQYLGLKYMINFTPKILSLSICSNLLPFYVFLKTDRLVGVKGVLAAMFTLALIVFILFIFV
ncbi:MAG: hypothetical protein LBP63_04440 [Prevotellaceae bacterium]|jgi:hypothetical protein|nr:hypothetical protein [Prevotellaceae bacterium]